MYNNRNFESIDKFSSERFMSIALDEAKKAYMKGEVPVGAIVVKGKKIISKAHNLTITKNDPTAHAEILAIRAAAKKLENYRLVDCVLYTTLEPCPMCAGALINSRIKEVFFALKDENWGACGSVVDLVTIKKFNHRVKIGNKMCIKYTNVSLKLIKNFFKKLRKRKKRVK